MPDRFTDPVVAELHAVREAMLESAGGNIDVMMRQVGERQRTSGRRVIMQPLQKRTEQFDAAEVRAPRVPVVDQPPHPADQ